MNDNSQTQDIQTRDIQKIVTTCTRDCPNTCGLVATVENGRLVKLTGSKDHPLTRGAACRKTAGYIRRVYSKERITHPMMKKDGQWKKVFWDEALDRVAREMKTIKEEDEAQAILYYQGYGERTALKLLNKYFFNLFGPVTTLHGSLCGGTGQASQNMNFGRRISHDPLDHYNSKAMILWARNPVTTNISLVRIMKDIRKKGGRVVVIDPFKNRSATLADRHIAPAPGRDIYLALAAARIIYDQGGEEQHFIDHHSIGGAEFKALVFEKNLDTLCDLAGVSLDDAEYIAESLTRFSPASILLGWGLHRHKDAHNAIRAIDALGAISGNIGIAGGGVSQGFEEFGPYDPTFWGDHLHPGRRTLSMPIIGEELLTTTDPKIRMIFTTAANPVCMAPNTGKVTRAFQQVEFKVYSGHFMDDTAELADVFLPATTFLEEDDVMASYGHNYVGPVNKAIEPVGECRSEFHIFSELARRFDFADRFCRGAESWLHDICAPIREAGCSMDALKKGAFRLPEPMVPYPDKTFETPSGKYQFLTKIDPDTSEPARPEYPYTLLTVAPQNFLCSERTLEDHPPLPVVKLNASEATEKGLADGMEIRLKSPKADLSAQLKTDPDLRRDIVVAERGGWLKAGHGLNRLTSDVASTVGFGTPYYDTRVDISRNP